MIAVCNHGNLRRQCLTCEQDGEITRLAEENEELRRQLAEAKRETIILCEKKRRSDIRNWMKDVGSWEDCETFRAYLDMPSYDLRTLVTADPAEKELSDE